MQETQVRILGGEDPLEEGMATHSSIPAWKISWTEEPGGPQSKGLQNRTRLNTHTRGKAQGVLMLLGKGLGRLSWFSGPLFSLPQCRGRAGREGVLGWEQGPGFRFSLAPLPRSPPAPGQQASMPIHVRPGWAVEEWGWRVGGVRLD